MPRSKKRKHHHEHVVPAGTVKSKKNRSAVTVAVVFFGILGLGIAFFAAGPSVLWLIAGTAVGVVGGYFFGRQIDRSFSKNS
jgi:hypothetical protein